MEPPDGVLANLWNFIFFFPFFLGLLLLGIIKGIIFCPFICLVMTVGISSIILGLWPAHALYTYHCILKAKAVGPVLKAVMCLVLPIVLAVWPPVGVVGGLMAGASYGLLSPIFATFEAVGEGRSHQLYHCFLDGTWSTLEGSFTAVRDVMDVCFYSYFSTMKEVRDRPPVDGYVYEIRLLDLPAAVAAGLVGIVVDFPVVSFIALFKCPYMLFKGWGRLFHDLIGREGPFLETICVPFAGLAILLWPLAVLAAALCSSISGIFFGVYAGVVAYQESSTWLGLAFVAASMSLYDEYSNDVLDMAEGSCFPRPRFRKHDPGVNISWVNTRQPSFSRPQQPVRGAPSRSMSLKSSVAELKPLELLDQLFEECRQQGETMIPEGLISIDDTCAPKSKSGGGSVISIGLPAYCLLQILLRSAKADFQGLLLSGGAGEISSGNRPRDAFFDWFLNPLLIIKDQVRALALSEQEERHLSGLVLFSADLKRLKASDMWAPPESERRRAELDALARRLRGITLSISRYPTYRRRFEALVRGLHDHLSASSGNNGLRRSGSSFFRRPSLDSPKCSKTSDGSAFYELGSNPLRR